MPHVAGDLIKCYAVQGTDFFRWYTVGESLQIPFDERALERMMRKAADMIQLDVYGGDCIIRPDGQPVLIDLNDWPSFSPCRDEAAQAITKRIVQRIEQEHGGIR